MKKGKFINKDHKSNDPKIDSWIITKRDAILEWFEAERLKADYDTASDEEMLTAIASHVQKMCYADPSHWWDNVLCEIAECVLDIDDEWKMGHYDIEEWLLDNIKWRPEDCKKSAVDWLGDLHYQICNGGMAQACYNGYVDDLIEAYGSFDEWVDALQQDLTTDAILMKVDGKVVDKVIEVAKFIAKGVSEISMTKGCPDCDGAGYTTYEEENEDGEPETHEETCGECGGSGVLDVDCYRDVDFDVGGCFYTWDNEYYALVDKDKVGDAIDDLTHQSHTHSIVLDAIKAAK